ncbi:MAG: CocE/NonD family hydrolase [Bacillota bacterium]
MITDTYMLPMRDSVRLATDLYLPEGDGPHPIILLRTPYGRWQMKGLAAVLTGGGYGLLVQDVRGTGGSEGTFGLYAQEPPDALDLAEWLVGQPWCDGRLGILGLSYCAGAAIPIAAAMPERVKACIWVTVPISRDLLSWQGGAMQLHHAAPWTMLLAEPPPLKARDWQSFYRTLPLAEMVPQSPVWRGLCEGVGAESPFWASMDLSRYLDQVRAPGLHAGGWYDFILHATLEPYRRMLAASGAPQRLLVGPWSHNAILAAPEFQRAMFAWLDRWFHGRPDPSAPVTLYLTGEGEGSGWRDLAGWPAPDAVPQTLYLAEGRLQPEPPAGGSRHFRSDPDDPVPTQGGAVWEFPAARMGLEPGPAVQTTGERPDVLTFDTDPAEAPLPLCGEVEVALWASASTPDADFAVKLCDVAPDGTARYIADAILRARYRHGMDRPEPLIPGEVYPLRLSMACAHLLAPGHRLRLEVAGSNFPKYDRNLHTGGDNLRATAAEAVVAEQVIWFGRSHVSLPVLGSR